MTLCFNMIKRDKLSEVSLVNPDLKLFVIESPHFKYLKISNFLKYPNQFIEVLSEYPALVGPPYLSFPGARQNFTPIEIKNILMAYRVILNQIGVQTDPTKWISSTNIMWKDVECLVGSRKPHYDIGSMVANLWLSDHQGGTSFYKYKETKLRAKDLDESENIFAERENSIDIWKNFEGDADWQKYYMIPSEFNTVHIYDGSFFHAAFPELTDSYRYSLVSFYHEEAKFFENMELIS